MLKKNKVNRNNSFQMSRAQSKRSIRVPECWTLRILDASCPCFSSTFSIICIMMLPFTAGWEFSQVPSLAQCNRKPWRSESRPHCLYSISDITKLSSTSLGKLKTSPFFFKPCILYYTYVSYVYQNRYALKGICIFQLQFKFLLTRESYKGYINIFIGATAATHLSPLLFSVHWEHAFFYNMKLNASWFF